jgi:DNA-binding response OmpR family regulator
MKVTMLQEGTPMAQSRSLSYNIHALIVAPTLDIANSISQVLSRYCPEVVTTRVTTNVQEALYVAEQDLCNLVIAYISSTESDGYALCRTIRADTRTATMPVMLVGDHISNREKIAGFTCGADDVIIRPIDERLFVSRLRLLWRLKSA